MSGSSRGGGGRGGAYRNPCITMHQPWASLLIHGIKRIEGRSWPAPITGRLWIHAAGKVPDPATIKAMEEFYRSIYAVDGITEIKFPEHYPVSRLLGCVEVVGCLKCEEVVCWEDVPKSVRLEGLTDFCWLCEQPKKLVIPFEMRGNQGVYNLERKTFDAAFRGLCPVRGPFPVQFPLPDPQNPFSLRPGSISPSSPVSKASTVEKSPSLIAAIARARSAATQFYKKDQSNDSTKMPAILVGQDSANFREMHDSKLTLPRDDKSLSLTSNVKDGSSCQVHTDSCHEVKCQSKERNKLRGFDRGVNSQLMPPSKLFATAMKGLQLE